MKSSQQKLYGGIEAGGTKFVCAVGTGPGDVKAIDTFTTVSPESTLPRVVEFFRKETRTEPIAALGIASFGPLDLNPESTKYGRIISTPKPDWSGIDLPGYFRDKLSVPVFLDTDVNGAALAENTWGAARDVNSVVYITVGTGIGGGGIINGQLLRGISHPEMGHIRIPHDYNEDPFPGSCPYHGDCLEGLASGTAIQKRWGKLPEKIPAGHTAWKLEAKYLALAVVDYIYTLAPQRIVIGGGIMKTDGLLAEVREKVVELLHGYGSFPEVTEDIAEYIVRPGLGDLSGVLGAMTLARKSAEK